MFSLSGINDYFSVAKQFLHDENVRKRLFILECRSNLSILSMIDWDTKNKSKLIYAILPELKYDITLVLLSHFKNDFINNITSKMHDLLIEDDVKQDCEPKDQLVQIISKIKALHLIAKLASEDDSLIHANIQTRIKNLRRIYLTILEEIKL